MDIRNLKLHLAEHKQEHLLQFWDFLEPQEQTELFQEISQLNIPEVVRYFENTRTSNSHEKLDDRMEPIPVENCGSAFQTNIETLNQYEKQGLQLIRQGKVASLLLAGGQGTRLGVTYPKGMYDVGLPSGKTLFQLQAERLRRVETLASSSLTGSESGSIPWYIMTSEGTKNPTLDFFRRNDYFGLLEDNVVVFEQGMLPTFNFDGKIILEGKSKISKAPDGNGGLYRALRDKGILKDMKSRGIEYVHVYCVDNILVKIADPVFIGYCVSKRADCGAKVVEKTRPTEQVGVFCKVDGKYQVVEYSEITSQTAEMKNTENGRLTFNAGNICNHFFTTSFLEKLVSGLEDTLKHHIATKKIPFADFPHGNVVNPQKPNGVKLEKFVFDVFRFSDQFAVWEVPREEDFSPLKNADTESKDTPTTCRNDLFTLHQKYLLDAGIKVTKIYSDDNNNAIEGETRSSHQVPPIEISPLVSYAGEGLEYLVNNHGKELQPPTHIASKIEKLNYRFNSSYQINVLQV